MGDVQIPERPHRPLEIVLGMHQEQHFVRFHRTALPHPLIPSRSHVEVRQQPADRKSAGPVHDHTDGSALAMAQEEDHGAVEIPLLDLVRSDQEHPLVEHLRTGPGRSGQGAQQEGGYRDSGNDHHPGCILPEERLQK